MIVLARVDDRLIHGLVAVAWTSHLAPETILVANDAVANDEMKKNIMKLAKPAGVKLFIKTRDAAAKALNNPINDGKRIFLVTETVEDAAYVHGLLVHPFDTLNIGTARARVVSYDAFVLIASAVASADPTTTFGGVVVPIPFRPIHTNSSSPPTTKPVVGSPIIRPTSGPMIIGRSSICCPPIRDSM